MKRLQAELYRWKTSRREAEQGPGKTPHRRRENDPPHQPRYREKDRWIVSLQQKRMIVPGNHALLPKVYTSLSGSQERTALQKDLWSVSGRF
jgi:hypothetical protein